MQGDRFLLVPGTSVGVCLRRCGCGQKAVVEITGGSARRLTWRGLLLMPGSAECTAAVQAAEGAERARAASAGQARG